MKKVIRLSEQDLVRLVRRVIKEEGEEREFLSENECEDLFKTMEFIYKNFVSHIHMNLSDESDEQEALEIYDDFQSEASRLLQVGEDLECEELANLYYDYDNYSKMILDLLGLN